MKPMYRMSELGELLEMSADSARRLVRDAGIATQQIGSVEFVPISEFKERLPKIWASLMLLHEMGGRVR